MAVMCTLACAGTYTGQFVMSGFLDLKVGGCGVFRVLGVRVLGSLRSVLLDLKVGG